MKPGTTIVLTIAMVLGILAGGYVFKFNETPERIELKHGSLIQNPRALQPFSLKDHRQQAFDLNSVKGQWSLLNFGYTHCPDICPTTLAVLSQMDGKLSPEVKKQLNVFFISVDPDRDTLEHLAKYVTFFNKDFIGATGPEKKLEPLTRELGVLYRKVEQKDSAMDYTLDHSALIYLIDPHGRLRAVFNTSHHAGGIAEDITTMVNT